VKATEMYIRKPNQNWDEARRYYQKGADLMHVRAISVLAVEAQLGFFRIHGGAEKNTLVYLLYKMTNGGRLL
jgi:hypothetical protein